MPRLQDKSVGKSRIPRRFFVPFRLPLRNRLPDSSNPSHVDAPTVMPGLVPGMTMGRADGGAFRRAEAGSVEADQEPEARDRDLRHVRQKPGNLRAGDGSPGGRLRRPASPCPQRGGRCRSCIPACIRLHAFFVSHRETDVDPRRSPNDPVGGLSARPAAARVRRRRGDGFRAFRGAGAVPRGRARVRRGRAFAAGGRVGRGLGVSGGDPALRRRARDSPGSTCARMSAGRRAPGSTRRSCSRSSPPAAPRRRPISRSTTWRPG